MPPAWAFLLTRLCGDNCSPLIWFSPLWSLPLSLFFCIPLVQVLALKLGKLRSEQRDAALNIPPMAQNFRGPEIYHRHLVEMVPPLCRSAPETESRAPRHQAHGPG